MPLLAQLVRNWHVPVPWLNGSIHVVVLLAGIFCLLALLVIPPVLFVMLASRRRPDHPG